MEEMNTLDPVSEWSHPACKRLLSRYVHDKYMNVAYSMSVNLIKKRKKNQIPPPPSPRTHSFFGLIKKKSHFWPWWVRLSQQKANNIAVKLPEWYFIWETGA